MSGAKRLMLIAVLVSAPCPVVAGKNPNKAHATQIGMTMHTGFGMLNASASTTRTRETAIDPTIPITTHTSLLTASPPDSGAVQLLARNDIRREHSGRGCERRRKHDPQPRRTVVHERPRGRSDRRADYTLG